MNTLINNSSSIQAIRVSGIAHYQQEIHYNNQNHKGVWAIVQVATPPGGLVFVISVCFIAPSENSGIPDTQLRQQTNYISYKNSRSNRI
jgi:hypothetical protein